MRRRIVFIAANVDTLYEAGIIKAMSQQAGALGCDLIVLTHFINYENGSDTIKGDENIYTLIKQLSFDGAILDSGTYYSKGLVERIEDMLHEKGVPVISLDRKSRYFESCMQNDREGFRQVTEHFIKVHGFRKIYCISGPKENPHSDERIKGYKDALRENGIAVRNKYIFYGDFWVDYPMEFAGKILSGEIEKPEAIVCGNDYMALQMCLSLISGGINVPDEISIGGFDGNPDALKYQPTITTFYGAYIENAVQSVCRLHELISGETRYSRIIVPANMRIGTSCGCKKGLSSEYCNKNRILDDAFLNSVYLHSSYSSMMNNVSNIRECAEVISRNIYLINGESELFVCLNSDVLSDDCGSAEYRKTGYSDSMTCIMSYSGGSASINEDSFGIDSIVPEKYSSDKCMTYICTPLHYLDRCFGYCVRRYSEGNIVFEPYYGDFCQVAANSAEKVRMLRYENSLNERIQKLSERDILTGLYSRKGLDKWTEEADLSRNYYAVLYLLGDGTDSEDEKLRKNIVAFAQAVNLSCTGGTIAARTAVGEFMMIGECDSSAHPEQFLINTLKTNIKMIEKQNGIQLVDTLTHFVAVSENGEPPKQLIAMLEEKLESYKCSGSEKNSAYLSMIKELHYSIYEEPQLEWSSEKESERIGISQSYFQHLYRQYLNISFNADVIAARITLAERLLLNTSLNVSEIAERCGYSDASHFMKLFRRKNGRTALEYRKNTH